MISSTWASADQQAFCDERKVRRFVVGPVFRVHHVRPVEYDSVHYPQKPGRLRGAGRRELRDFRDLPAGAVLVAQLAGLLLRRQGPVRAGLVAAEVAGAPLRLRLAVVPAVLALAARHLLGSDAE